MLYLSQMKGQIGKLRPDLTTSAPGDGYRPQNKNQSLKECPEKSGSVDRRDHGHF